MSFLPMYRRVRSALVAVASVALLAGCEDFLTAENPGAVEADDLNDPRYVGLMTNGVIREFQIAFPRAGYYNALFSDELYNTHVFFEERLIDRRDVAQDNGTYAAFVYNPLHRARFLADSVAGRLKVILADSAGRDLRLSRVLAYGGYSYILLGEMLCESPIDISAAHPPEALFGFAIDRFDEAITVAQAAKAVTGASPATIAIADSLIAFARVGAARASLGRGDMADAITYASAVPANFEFRAWYSENTSGENNYWWGRISSGSSGSNSGGLNNTPFLAMAGDPRVPRPATDEAAMNGQRVFIPNSPTAFSTYTGTATGADITRSASIRIASGLEARYIVAEAEGNTTANVDFVNTRRAIGGALPLVAPTDAEYFAALRDQRRRDLYLDNHRLGDLRRYKELYGIDEFQTGAYPSSTTGETYTQQTCFPITLAERNGNPNL